MKVIMINKNIKKKYKNLFKNTKDKNEPIEITKVLKTKSAKLAALVLTFTSVLTGCSPNNTPTGSYIGINIKDELPPTVTSAPELFPTATDAPNNTDTPDITNIPDISLSSNIPSDIDWISTDFNKTYNFINKMPVISTDNGIYNFGNDDLFTIYKEDSLETYSIHELLNYEELNNPDAMWFFEGAEYYNNIILAQYTYLSTENYSIVILINTNELSVNICTIRNYSSNENYNFTFFIGERIYYTDTVIENDVSVCALLSCCYNGTDTRTEFILEDKNDIYAIFPYESNIYYLCGQKDSLKNLCMYDINNRTSKTIKESISADFLYLYNNCALLSYSETGRLIYLDLDTLKLNTLKLVKDGEINTGLPIICNDRLLIPIYPVSENSLFDTKLAVIDTDNVKVSEYIECDRNSLYSIGSVENNIIMDSLTSYIFFDINTLEIINEYLY